MNTTMTIATEAATDLDQLTVDAERRLVDAIWLDETVHDTAARLTGDIDAAEQVGSAINNGGIATQIAYLAGTGWTTAELAGLIDQRAGERTAGRQPW